MQLRFGCWSGNPAAFHSFSSHHTLTVQVPWFAFICTLWLKTLPLLLKCHFIIYVARHHFAADSKKKKKKDFPQQVSLGGLSLCLSVLSDCELQVECVFLQPGHHEHHLANRLRQPGDPAAVQWHQQPLGPGRRAGLGQREQLGAALWALTHQGPCRYTSNTVQKHHAVMHTVTRTPFNNAIVSANKWPKSNIEFGSVNTSERSGENVKGTTASTRWC